MTHIVFFKLKERTPQNQQSLLQILNKLDHAHVPCADTFQCGADVLASERSYDAALVVGLPAENLDTYANDPYHCQIKKEMAPLLDHSVTVDFE